VAIDASRRVALLQAKLGALVAANWPDSSAAPVPLSAGSGAFASGPPSLAWALVDESRVARDPLPGDDPDADANRLPRGWLGGSIIWASRLGATQLHILSEHFDGHDARRAAYFGHSGCVVTLWKIDGRELQRLEPAPLPVPVEPPATHRAFLPLIQRCGADALVDHGTVTGEVLGLEVARVVAFPDAAPELHIGVGRHDRLAHQMLHPGAEAVESSLIDVVATVRQFRNADAPPHPANTLVRQRWLRAMVVADPLLVGLDVGLELAGTADAVGRNILRSAAGTSPMRLKGAAPAIARTDGLIVACTAGLDLDAVGDAADARAWHEPKARLVVVATEDHRALRLLVADLLLPAELVIAPMDWRRPRG
jgi:hypothetical protein